MRHRIVSFDDSTRLGLCSVCGPVSFKLRIRNGYTQRECKTKVRQAAKKWGAKRDRMPHGLKRDEVEALKASQDFRCAVCGRVAPLVIDHDHACHPGQEGCRKCIRGALCVPCNAGLGSFRDDPEALRLGIAYLEAKNRPVQGATPD